MNYFIGYLIQGEAALWHFNLAKDISEKFGLWELHKKLPPHITIFYPFNIEDIDSIKNILRNWVQHKSIPGKFTLSDFDHFDDKVVFAKVETDNTVKENVCEVQGILKEIPGMPKEEYPTWHPHATLANRVSSEEIKKVWDYVSTVQKPNFVIPYENITVFRYEGDRKWVVDEIFKFN